MIVKHGLLFVPAKSNIAKWNSGPLCQFLKIQLETIYKPLSRSPSSSRSNVVLQQSASWK